jgi:hypothetical protein
MTVAYMDHNDLAPIKIAYANKHLNTVTAMIQAHRATPGDNERYGFVLVEAARDKHWDLCRLLLSQGAPISCRSSHPTSWFSPMEYTALYFFIEQDQVDLAIQAIRAQPFEVRYGNHRVEQLLAIEKKQWPILKLFIEMTTNILQYAELIRPSAEAQQWGICHAILQKANPSRNIDFEPYFLSEALPTITQFIRYLYTEKQFEKIFELINKNKDAKNQQRRNPYQKLLTEMDNTSKTVYVRALTETENESYFKKYETIRPTTQDIDWALCGAAQKGCIEEMDFLLENGGDELYALIGAVIGGNSCVFEHLKTHSVTMAVRNSSLVAAGVFSRKVPTGNSVPDPAPLSPAQLP